MKRKGQEVWFIIRKIKKRNDNAPPYFLYEDGSFNTLYIGDTKFILECHSLKHAKALALLNERAIGPFARHTRQGK